MLPHVPSKYPCYISVIFHELSHLKGHLVERNMGSLFVRDGNAIGSENLAAVSAAATNGAYTCIATQNGMDSTASTALTLAVNGKFCTLIPDVYSYAVVGLLFS